MSHSPLPASGVTAAMRVSTSNARPARSRFWRSSARGTRVDFSVREELPPESSGSGLSSNTRRMLNAIESLPTEEREAFELVRIQGLTAAEVAGIVGISERTVQRRISRGLVLLMGSLADLRPFDKARGDS